MGIGVALGILNLKHPKSLRDNIIERQLQGSELYSLDDFKVRYDKQIERDYLLGRYGAVPLLRTAIIMIRLPEWFETPVLDQ